jgi:hypothetical protein
MHRRELMGAGLVLLLLLPAAARGDGGTVRASERRGDYQVTVFTSPTPFRAGPVDVSVLVQDAATKRPVSDVAVTLLLSPVGQPERVMVHPATVETATNKLFHSAKFDLPEAGRWLVQVQVGEPPEAAEVRLEVEAAEPLPRWREMAEWIFLPVVPIALFIVHQVLVRRQEGRLRSLFQP